MNIWMKRCLEAGVIAGGLWVLGTGLASAQDLDHSSSTHGGSVLDAPVSAPVTVSGNAIALLGHSHATANTGQPASTPTTAPRAVISIPVTAPVTICGNAIGSASASCGSAGSGSTTTGSSAAVAVPITAPFTVCGNGVGLFGAASATCGTPTGISTGSSGGSSSGSSTSGIDVPVTAPVTVCGNGAGVLGSAGAGCSGTGSNPPASGGGTGTGTPTQAGASQSVDGVSTDRPLEKIAVSLASKPTSARSLAFTGSSPAVLERLAATLVALGTALSFALRRRTT